MDEKHATAEFRPRVLTSFMGVHLEDVQKKFEEAKRLRQPGEHPEDLIKRLEPDDKKRERLKMGIAVLGRLKTTGIDLQDVKEVLVWSTPNTESLSEVKLEIRTKSRKGWFVPKPLRF